jgi:3-hydroxyacyl-[acyl-carrier-protein] dehydratase
MPLPMMPEPMTAMVSIGTTKAPWEASIISNARTTSGRLYSAFLRSCPSRAGQEVTGIFDGLTVLEETVDERGWRARLRVEPSSRAFAGHFEGEPILPGIAHLVVVAHALRAIGGAATSLRELPSVRFRHVIRPGDVLDVVVLDDGGRCRFEVHVAGALAAAGVARRGADA